MHVGDGNQPAQQVTARVMTGIAQGMAAKGTKCAYRTAPDTDGAVRVVNDLLSGGAYIISGPLWAGYEWVVFYLEAS